MLVKTLRHLLSLGLFGLAACLVLFSTKLHASDAELPEKYELIKDKLTQNAYGIPIYIESTDIDNTMRGDIYGILYHPFARVRRGLSQADNWCAIAPLHLNIKACTVQPLNDHCEITFYTGRKYYENPEDVYQLPYIFRPLKGDTTYFHVRLMATQGPMGTRDYIIAAEAIPLNDSQTFLHFSYSYHYNFFTQLGMQTYLATLGRNKIGFTLESSDDNRPPEFVHGVRGIIERNAVRYYFAIQSYLDTTDIQADKRFNARLQHWFDLTERYHLQLHELEKADYLEYKQLEHQDQLRLQRIVDSNDPQKCSPP